MSSLDDTLPAITVARSGAARAGACRSSFAPNNTVNVAGTARGPEEAWTEAAPATAAWTTTAGVEPLV